MITCNFLEIKFNCKDIQKHQHPRSKYSIIQSSRPQIYPDTEWCQAFFYFNCLNTDFSEIVRKQYTIAKFAYHNFILAYISNSIGVIIPILVKKVN